MKFWLCRSHKRTLAPAPDDEAASTAVSDAAGVQRKRGSKKPSSGKLSSLLSRSAMNLPAAVTATALATTAAFDSPVLARDAGLEDDDEIIDCQPSSAGAPTRSRSLHTVSVVPSKEEETSAPESSRSQAAVDQLPKSEDATTSKPNGG